MTDSRTRLDRLVALRDHLEAVLRIDIPARDLATASREYRAVLAEIAELEPKKAAGDPVDEIAARRAARRPGATARTRRAKLSGE